MIGVSILELGVARVQSFVSRLGQGWKVEESLDFDDFSSQSLPRGAIKTLVFTVGC